MSTGQRRFELFREMAPQLAGVVTSYFQRQKQELDQQKALETFRNMAGANNSGYTPEDLTSIFNTSGHNPIASMQFLEQMRTNKLLNQQRERELQKPVDKPFIPSTQTQLVMRYLAHKGVPIPKFEGPDESVESSIYGLVPDWKDFDQWAYQRELEARREGAIVIGDTTEERQLRKEQRDASAELEGATIELNDADDAVETASKALEENRRWLAGLREVGKSDFNEEVKQAKKNLAKYEDDYKKALARKGEAKARIGTLTKRKSQVK